MIHSKEVNGQLWVACGGFIKKWDKLGCFLGDLESQKKELDNAHQIRPL